MSRCTSSLRLARLHSTATIRQGRRAFSSSSPRNKERLVILGSGWGGYEVLRSVDKKRWGTFIPSENTYIEVQADHVYIFVQMSLLSLLRPTSTSRRFWLAVPLALLNSDPQ